MFNDQIADISPFIDMITDHVLSVMRQETTPMGFLTGEVVSVNPLAVKLNSKITLREDELLLSATVKETWIDIPTTNGVAPGEDAGTDGVFMHRHHIVAETEEANDGGQGASNHKHKIDIYTKYDLPKIRLWRGLIVGDVVRLIQVQGGQFYFIVEREEKITNETPEEEQNDESVQ